MTSHATQATQMSAKAERVTRASMTTGEVLTCMPSDASPRWSDVALEGAGRLLRRLHDVLAGFVPPSDAVWRVRSIAPRAGDGAIGHNDLCMDNAVYADGIPYGFIVWDMAGPALPGRGPPRRPAGRSNGSTRPP